MNKFALTFHHFGLAVKKLARVQPMLMGLGYETNNQVWESYPARKSCLGHTFFYADD